ARKLLPGMLLGGDGAAVWRRSDEPAVGGRAVGICIGREARSEIRIQERRRGDDPGRSVAAGVARFFAKKQISGHRRRNLFGSLNRLLTRAAQYAPLSRARQQAV